MNEKYQEEHLERNKKTSLKKCFKSCKLHGQQKITEMIRQLLDSSLRELSFQNKLIGQYDTDKNKVPADTSFCYVLRDGLGLGCHGRKILPMG